MVDGGSGDNEALAGDLTCETSYGTGNCELNIVRLELV